jgi:hypothetical protein
MFSVFLKGSNHQGNYTIRGGAHLDCQGDETTPAIG